MTVALDPHFGTFALAEPGEAWRIKAAHYKDNRWGRAMISRCRKRAMATQSEPYDVVIELGIKARLYPSQNRCEKRAFCGVQIWDTEERAALKDAIIEDISTPFVFLDVGANVGLYSLYVNAYAKSITRATRILAIEPGLETCTRLETNIKANRANVQIIRAAISDEPGSGFLGGGDTNRGEAKLVSGGKGVEPVVIDTLARICFAHSITHIDALKLDIEGHDFKALNGFFEDAPKKLHPKLIIAETSKDKNSPIVALCESHNYMVSKHSGLNTIFKKKTHGQT